MSLGKRSGKDVPCKCCMTRAGQGIMVPAGFLSYIGVMLATAGGMSVMDHLLEQSLVFRRRLIKYREGKTEK